MALIQIDEPIIETSNTSSNLVIGIDLGTTNSLVGTVINEKVKLFCDDKKNDIHPYC